MYDRWTKEPWPLFWLEAMIAAIIPTPIDPANCWSMLKNELISAVFSFGTLMEAFEIEFEKPMLKPNLSIQNAKTTNNAVNHCCATKKTKLPSVRQLRPIVIGSAYPWESAILPAKGDVSAPMIEPGNSVKPATIADVWRTYWQYTGITNEMPMLINCRLK